MIPDCRDQHALWEELAEIHMGFLFFSQKGGGGILPTFYLRELAEIHMGFLFFSQRGHFANILFERIS